MRDTLIGILVFLGAFGGYYYARQKGLANLKFPTVNPISSDKKSEVKGATHDSNSQGPDSKNTAFRKNPAHGKSEGSSTKASQDQGLPSIYWPKRHKLKSSGPAKKKKRVGGVDADAWALAREDSLASYLPPSAPPGMRIFIQCMELKNKGLEYIGPDTCRELLSRRDFSSPSL